MDDNDRIKAALWAIIEERFPRLKFAGVFEYRVIATDGETVDASPVDSTLGMPDVFGVTMRSAIPGLSNTPVDGASIGVAFLDGNPGKPVAFGYDTLAAALVSFNAGTGTAEHLTTAESLVSLFQQLATAIPGPWTGGAIATALATAIAATFTIPLSPANITAIAAVLAAKTDDAGGTTPGIGCPNIKGG